MIHDVVVSPLEIISDERGSVFRMLKRGDTHFSGFGEIYFSEILAGAVKPWRCHLKNTSQLAVPLGSVRIALYDGRPSSSTYKGYMEVVSGRENYQLTIVPPGVWTLFLGIGPGTSLIANCSDAPHDPSEVIRRDAHDPEFPITWQT